MGQRPLGTCTQRRWEGRTSSSASRFLLVGIAPPARIRISPCTGPVMRPSAAGSVGQNAGRRAPRARCDRTPPRAQRGGPHRPHSRAAALGAATAAVERPHIRPHRGRGTQYRRPCPSGAGHEPPVARAGYGCKQAWAPVVAERLACADGIVRCLPGTQSVNAGTSNERQAILPTEGLKVAATAEARGKNQPLG